MPKHGLVSSISDPEFLARIFAIAPLRILRCKKPFSTKPVTGLFSAGHGVVSLTGVNDVALLPGD